MRLFWLPWGGVTANFALDAATTAEPNDFALSLGGVPVTGTSVTIPEGQFSVSITLSALDDTAADTDNESVVLNLAAGTGYQVSTTVNTQTINILDDEGSNAPTLTVPGPAPTYTENGAPLILDATATVFDPDSPNFDTGNLTASSHGGGNSERSPRHQSGGEELLPLAVMLPSAVSPSAPLQAATPPT
ncbi:MAG: hypothetical protein HC925_07950 [Coleofasciculaceae cyanobacterium SM2_3_26]|nr:hypothetical protein [Coleofasciculaceae cyanobacterium SM2_3_26]